MTVSYTAKLANYTCFGVFWKLLFRWKGSVYKLIWPDLLAYSVVYFTLSAIYRFVLTKNGRRVFEKVSLQTKHYTDMIPVAFLLGFYVSIVVQRWWQQFEKFTVTDPLCLLISSHIKGNDHKSQLMRKTILRYVNLACIMTFRLKSPMMQRRYPSIIHLIDAGLLTKDEHKIIEYFDSISTHPKYAIAFVWAGMLTTKAREEKKIESDHALLAILNEIGNLRNRCGTLLDYDWISIPLVYTQVVTIAVYSFFLATLLGRQFLDPEKKYDTHEVDFVIPVFTYLQIIFYMGWLKVAEALIHPFGDDDDDFDVIWFIDRCLKMTYLLVDQVHAHPPLMVTESYWNEFSSNIPTMPPNHEYRTWSSTATMTTTTESQETMLVNEKEKHNKDSILRGPEKGCALLTLKKAKEEPLSKF